MERISIQKQQASKNASLKFPSIIMFFFFVTRFDQLLILLQEGGPRTIHFTFNGWNLH